MISLQVTWDILPDDILCKIMWRRDEIFYFFIGKGHTSFREKWNPWSCFRVFLKFNCILNTNSSTDFIAAISTIDTESLRRKKVDSKVTFDKTFASNRFEGFDSALRMFIDQMPPLLKMSCGLDGLLHLIPVIPYFLQVLRALNLLPGKAVYLVLHFSFVSKVTKIILPTREMERPKGVEASLWWK